MARLRAANDRAKGERDQLWLDAVKYLFITLIEGCVDVAQHVAASEQHAAPNTNADAIRSLAQHHIIGSDLADSLARAVGFRNVLVHQYLEVDDNLVVEALGRLDEFDRFIGEVGAWVLDQT
ncbi:MAG: DUF86 domain-containing protein [Microthrixaceae bacterium]